MCTFWAWRVVGDSRAELPKQRMARLLCAHSEGQLSIFKFPAAALSRFPRRRAPAGARRAQFSAQFRLGTELGSLSPGQ